MKHFIITRFNLGLYSKYSQQSADDWMNYRLWLFEQTALTSVKKQTNQSFKWICLLDRNTSDKHREILYKYAHNYKNLNLFYTTKSNALAATKEALKKYKCNDGDIIATTRLDLDDILHNNFVAEIQKHFATKLPTLICCKSGYALSVRDNPPELREMEYTSNQFITLVERYSAVAHTVYCDEHPNMVKRFQTKVINNKRLWIWLFHKNNLSTKKFNTVGRQSDQLSKIRDVFNFRLPITPCWKHFLGKQYDDNTRNAVLVSLLNKIKYNNVLYVGATPNRMQALELFYGKNVDIIEIFKPYIDKLKASVLPNISNNFLDLNIFQGDITQAELNCEYDVVLWHHGPEHIKQNKLKNTLNLIESYTKKLVILACPFGYYPQHAIDNNIDQQHHAHLYPWDFACYKELPRKPRGLAPRMNWQNN